MSKVTFELPNYSVEQIKKEYYLNDLCVADTAQIENIAITIQSLYVYHSILMSGNYPRTIEASLCRTIIIMSYSILEAIVVSLGYKIQTNCINCKRRCPNHSVSMFSEKETYKNELKAFKNSDEFLTKIKIINLTNQARNYYNHFRDNRNNVHLARNANVISKDDNFTKKECNVAIEFLQGFIKLLQDNYFEYINFYKCGK